MPHVRAVATSSTPRLRAVSVQPAPVPCLDLPAGLSALGESNRRTSSTPTAQVHPQSEHRTGRWSDDEHKLFLTLMKKYGRSWTKIASVMKSRTEPQVRSHAQKYFQKQARQAEHQRAQQIRLDAIRSDRETEPMGEPAADPVKDSVTTTPITTVQVQNAQGCGSDDDDARAAGERGSHDSDHELSLSYSLPTEDETTSGEGHNPAI